MGQQFARGDLRADRTAVARLSEVRTRPLSFADGYDTVAGEWGCRLSGGEKEPLVIARVLLKDLRILILDDAAGAFDTTSERLVQ